jgi:predicted alpha/beta-fold hydrolase
MEWIRTIVNYFFLQGQMHNKTTKFYRKNKENVYLKSDDDQFTGAYLIGNTGSINNTTKFFVVCHGKGTDRHDAVKHAKLREYTAQNAIFLVVDYRGFGDSTAEFTKEGANKDIEAAFKHLKEKHKAQKIYLVGHSYGSAIALAYYKHATENKDLIKPEKVFLFAPWKTLSMIMHDMTVPKIIFGILPFLEKILFQDLEYENEPVIKMLNEKAIVFHGKRDELIPYTHSEEMAQNNSKTKFYFTDDHHDGVFENRANWEIVFKEAA